MKRKIFLAMTMALTTTFLASCSACDGCAGNTKVSFKDYFLQNVDYPVTEVNETLSYKVTHKGTNTYNGYTVKYSEGKYNTVLTKATGEDIYTLTTSFTIGVRFEYGGVSTEELTDTVTSTVKFYSAKNTLQPIYSEKTAESHSPTQNEPTKADDCYTLYHETVKIEYNGDCTGGVYTRINHAENDAKKSREFTIDNRDKYTYIDNEQLLFALRCMNPSTSATVQAYSPFNEYSEGISIAFESAVTEDFESLRIGEEEVKNYEIAYTPVTVKLQAENSGTEKTIWIAKTTDPLNNTYRNVMLKYVNPLPFLLGELHYDLVSASFSA